MKVHLDNIKDMKNILETDSEKVYYWNEIKNNDPYNHNKIEWYEYSLFGFKEKWTTVMEIYL